MAVVIEEKKKAEKNKTKDLSKGNTYLSEDRQDIVSECEGNRQQQMPFDTVKEEGGSLLVTGIRNIPVKKKRYYFYSPSSYAVTTLLLHGKRERPPSQVNASALRNRFSSSTTELEDADKFTEAEDELSRRGVN